GMMKDDMAGRVAGAVADAEAELADRHFVLVLEPAVGLERDSANAPAAAVVVEPRDPEAVGFVRAFDGNAELLCELARLSSMIDVAVREQDLLDRNPRLLGRCLELRQVAAGVDEGGAVGLRAPQQGAILLQRRNRRDRGLEWR